MFSLAAFLFASCDPKGVIEDDVFEDPGLVGVGHEEIVLGEKLDDPYTVENMRRAYVAMYPTKADDRETVVTSDLYVRFLPEDGSDYSALERLGLNLVDHPLDYEILRYGDYYHDPGLPEDKITWQYAVVGADFQFPPDITYEVLDECFIPDNVHTRAADVDWAAVEEMSFRMTGNDVAPRTKGSSGSPSGRITIMDETLSEEVGVAGVKVAVNSFVKISTAYTDSDGYYSIKRSYTSNLHYRLVFKNRRGFGIGVNLLLVPASISTLGKGPADGKSVCISSKSDRKLFCRCTVNNAANDYFQMCSEDGVGITPPPSNLRIWLFQKIGAGSAPMLQQSGWSLVDLVKRWLGDYGAILNGFLPDITLGVEGLDKYSSIYTLAWHELAHSSHFMKVGKQFWDKYIKFILNSFISSGGTTYGVGTEPDAGYAAIGEMWAYYMETRLLQEKYKVNGYTAGSSYWFYPQIFLYLEERGLTRGQIFAALSSDVTDRESLRAELLELYPSYRTAIRQVFERYQ